MRDFLIDQIGIIVWLQQLGPVLRSIAGFLTVLAEEQFFLLIIAIIYWSFNAVTGIRMMVLLVFSNALNLFSKYIFITPRPYWVSNDVIPLKLESSFSLPSRRAQLSMVMYTWLSRLINKQWAKVLAGVIIIVIGLALLISGLQYPIDIFAGWFIGFVILRTFRGSMISTAKPSESPKISTQIISALISALAFYGLCYLIAQLRNDWVMPPAWELNSRGAEPFNLIEAANSTGLWLGGSLGFIVLRTRRGMLASSQGGSKRCWRVLVGLAGAGLLHHIPYNLLPNVPFIGTQTFAMIRFFVLGIWITALSPLLFEKLGLAEIEPIYKKFTNIPPRVISFD